MVSHKLSTVFVTCLILLLPLANCYFFCVFRRLLTRMQVSNRNQMDFAEGLQEASRNPVNGSVIKLPEGSHTRQLAFSKEKMVLVGKGDRTVIKLDSAIVDNSSRNETSLPNTSGIQDGIAEPKEGNVTKVNSTEGLHAALRNGVRRSVIEFSEGTYIGQFVLTINDITLVGKGDRTVIKLDSAGTNNSRTTLLQISGNNCEIRNLKLLTFSKYTYGIQTQGSGTKISNVQFEGFHRAVNVSPGSENNTFSHLSIKNGGTGFDIRSNGNSLDNIQLENITGYGVAFEGNENQVDSLTCSKCKGGFHIKGNDNLIQSVEVKNSRHGNYKLVIYSGSGNAVDNYECGGDCCLYLNRGTSNAVVRNVVGDNVVVQGTGHHLVNVDAGTQLEVWGSGHRIDGYRAEVVHNWGTNVQLTRTDIGNSIQLSLKEIVDQFLGNDSTQSLTSPTGIPNEVAVIEIRELWNVTNRVNSTQGLQEALGNAERGSVIELSEGTYIGQFVLTINDITIVGKGDRTVIKLDSGGTFNSPTNGLRISGNNCEIRNLKLLTSLNDTTGIQTEGSLNKISNVQFEGFHRAVNVSPGSENNTFSHLSIKNGGWGINIESNGNSLANIQIENLTEIGVVIEGNKNKVDSLTCTKCNGGFFVEGNYNLIRHAEVKNSRPGYNTQLHIWSGRGNSIDSYKCGDHDCLILDSFCRNSVVRNVVGDDVAVWGSGHKLVNVDAGTMLRVAGSGHRIEGYKARKVENEGRDVELTQRFY